MIYIVDPPYRPRPPGAAETADSTDYCIQALRWVAYTVWVLSKEVIHVPGGSERKVKGQAGLGGLLGGRGTDKPHKRLDERDEQRSLSPRRGEREGDKYL